MYELKKFKKQDAPHKFFTMSFDDGTTQDFRLVEMLNKYGLRATFFINSGLLGQPGELSGVMNDKPWRCDHIKIKPEEVKPLYEGHECAVHTVTHPRLDLLEHDAALNEIEDDRKAIEALAEQTVVGMAYPGGPFYNAETLSIIKNETPLIYARTVGYTHNFDMPADLYEWAPTAWGIDDDLIDRAKAFLESESTEDQCFYVFAHAFEFDIHQKWEHFEKFCRYMAENGGFENVTNGELAIYINENK